MISKWKQKLQIKKKKWTQRMVFTLAYVSAPYNID